MNFGVQQIKVGSRAKERKTEEIKTVYAETDLANTLNEFDAYIRKLRNLVLS